MTNAEHHCGLGECIVCELFDANTNVCGYVVEHTPEGGTKAITPYPDITPEQEENLCLLVASARKKFKKLVKCDFVQKLEYGEKGHCYLECLSVSPRRSLYKVCFHTY